MDFSRYLQLLDQDVARVREVAARGLGAPVPPCPGWTVADVVTHLGFVYLHKVECMRRQAAPDPWPPADLPEREPLQMFDEAYAQLAEELRNRDPGSPAYTWYPPDQTVGFWQRRMAQETAVHRVDVESAYEVVTPVDPELAADGVDEVLMIMLTGDWSDEPVDDGAGKRIELVTADRAWTVELDREKVSCSAGTAEDPDARVSGDPSDLLLWAWGRAPLERLRLAGDRSAVAALRHRLALATR